MATTSIPTIEQLSEMLASLSAGLEALKNAQPVQQQPRPRDLRQQQSSARSNTFWQNNQTKALARAEDASVVTTSGPISRRTINTNADVLDNRIDRRFTDKEIVELASIGGSGLKMMINSVRLYNHQQGVRVFWTTGSVDEQTGQIVTWPCDEPVFVTIPELFAAIENAQLVQAFPFVRGTNNFVYVHTPEGRKQQALGSTFVIKDLQLGALRMAEARVFVDELLTDGVTARLDPASSASTMLPKICERYGVTDLFQVPEVSQADLRWFVAHLEAYRMGGGNANALAAMASICGYRRPYQGETSQMFNARRLGYFNHLNSGNGVEGYREHYLENAQNKEAFQAERQQQVAQARAERRFGRASTQQPVAQVEAPVAQPAKRGRKPVVKTEPVVETQEESSLFDNDLPF